MSTRAAVTVHNFSSVKKHDHSVFNLIIEQRNRLYSPYWSTHGDSYCPGLISFTFCACSAVAELPNARSRARPHHAPPPLFTNSLLSERYTNTMTKGWILMTQRAARLQWLAKKLTLVGGRYSDRELTHSTLLARLILMTFVGNVSAISLIFISCGFAGVYEEEFTLFVIYRIYIFMFL